MTKLDFLVVFYGILIIIVFLLSILFFIFYRQEEKKKQVPFYYQQINYQSDLEKYYKMVTRQKRILWKKKLQLFLLTIFVKIGRK